MVSTSCSSCACMCWCVVVGMSAISQVIHLIHHQRIDRLVLRMVVVDAAPQAPVQALEGHLCAKQFLTPRPRNMEQDIPQEQQRGGLPDHPPRPILCVATALPAFCVCQAPGPENTTDLPICPLHGVTLAFMEAAWQTMSNAFKHS